MRRRGSIRAITLTREQLYELVWTEPMRTLAKQFQISDVGLKKVCVRNRIPVPARGHWQKLAAGKTCARIPLPAVKSSSTISFAPRPASAASGAEPSLPDPAVAIERTFPGVNVAESLARPHPITVAMREELKRKTPDDYGAIHCAGADVPAARIHPGSSGRLLRIADALLKGFDRREFELRPGKPAARYWSGLQILVADETFTISIEERMRRETHRPTADELSRQRRGHYVWMRNYDYHPTGEFTLKIEPCYGSAIQSTWKDSRSRKIEQRLSEVMLSLRRHAALRKEERARAQRRAARLEIEQQRRADLRARVEAEQDAMDGLESDFDAWDRAQRIRAFVDAVERQPERLGIPDLAVWAAWARGCADRIDPLRESPSSILDTPEAEMRPVLSWKWEDDEE